MNTTQLVIGNYNYSSWSLRAWLALRHGGLAFTTHRLALDTPDFGAEVRRYSGAARVPVLVDGETTVWDSLAIAEYAAERSGRGWPEAPIARAVARAATAEMHSGFAALRTAWPMDIRARKPGTAADADVRRDLARIEQLWTDCRQRFGAGGPWLFGEYCIADAFYAPVACRIQTYGGMPAGAVARAYYEAALADPHLGEWSALAAAETETLT